ncbi:MAG: hypothetical protein ACE5IR_11000 [bacterium]
MNMQRRSDERSIALHREIAKKLRSNPNLWEIPKKNLVKWKKMKDRLTPAFIEWEHILSKNTKEQILSIIDLESTVLYQKTVVVNCKGILWQNTK